MTEREIQAERVLTVNARELHAFLEVGRDYSTWIRNRIVRGGLKQGVDFITERGILPKTGENNSRGQPPVEYHLTTDAAKHVAMMERGGRGREVRAYFIECEKRLKDKLRKETPRLTDDHFRADLADLRNEFASLKGLVIDSKNHTIGALISALDRRLGKIDNVVALRDHQAWTEERWRNSHRGQVNIKQQLDRLEAEITAIRSEMGIEEPPKPEPAPQPEPEPIKGRSLFNWWKRSI